MPETVELSVVLLEDNPGDARIIAAQLDPPSEFQLRTAGSLRTGLRELAALEASVVLLDLGLPDSTGVDTFRAVRRHTSAPVIVVSGHEDTAVEAVEEGAQDSLIKGRFDGEVLRRTIRFALARKRMETALLTKQSDFRAIIEQHPDGVIVIDPQGVVLYANTAAESLFGAAAPELIGRDFGYPLADDRTLVTLVPARGDSAARITAELRVIASDWEGQPATVVFVRDARAFVREQALLDRAVAEPPAPVAGAQFGSRPLAEADPALCQRLRAAYGDLLERMLDARAYKSAGVPDAEIAAFAEELAAARPAARDLIAIHTTVLREKLRCAGDARAQAYLEEARLLVLNVMGRLVTSYRPYALAGPPRAGDN